MLPKLLTTEQIRAADRYTIENEPISSINLMERASKAFIEHTKPYLSDKDSIAILCGPGNNGGDGLAVGRLLKSMGYQVNVVLFAKDKHCLSKDCLTNANRVKHQFYSTQSTDFPLLTEYTIIIDALFGSGLNRPFSGYFESLVAKINNSNAYVLSIDLPSGMHSDRLPDSNTSIVHSDMAICFQRPKFTFFLPESNTYCKQWQVANIGLNETFIQQQDSQNYVIDHHIQQKIRERARFSHKGSYGHAVVIAGAFGKMGAAVLSTKACLRSGVGLVTCYVPGCGYTIMQQSVPEAMCLTDIEEQYISQLPDLSAFSAIGVGPGLGTELATQQVIKKLMATDCPLIIDADGVNIMAKRTECLEQLPKHTILTPHPKEFERLAGKWKNSLERIERQRQFSKKYQCIVVLKDAHTCITDAEGNAYWNTSGNGGMATGGSGDVLTGIITGLRAQGYSALESALLGVYYHGKAGDAAAKQRGQPAMIAGDIIDYFRFGK